MKREGEPYRKFNAHEAQRIRDEQEQVRIPLARPAFEVSVEDWIASFDTRRALDARERLGSRVPTRRIK